jgi:radical SAM superfamily enzyme YgiQ (UPF0313 family)
MKNRILLVYPPSAREALSGFQPIGLSYIASYILSKSPEISVKIIDYSVERFSTEGWRQELRNFEPEVVGISVLTLNYPSGRLMSELVKDFDPGILTVMGGVHATMEPEQCLEHCDIVVRGEGEVTFQEVVHGHKLDAIRGVSYWRDGRIVHNEQRERINNLDALPFPEHSLFQIDSYSYKGTTSWGIMGSRGCPYKCAFCCSPRMWGSATRFRSTTNIVDEIEYLYNEFHIQNIVFFDDTLNISQRRTIEICEKIIKRGFHKKVSFECQLRVNKQLVSPELFQKMKEANFVSIDFGIESASARVLKSIGKSLTPDEAKRAIRMARKAGIKSVKGYFIVGNWGETIWDVFKTWRFVLSTNVEPAFSICTPFPGTEFYQRLKENGYLSDEPDWAGFNQTTPIARTDKMSKPSIFVVYIFSILLQLVLALIRGGRPIHTLSRMVAYTLDKLRLKS